MRKLINFIKRIYACYILFRNLKPGQIVWCKMPLSRKKLEAIDPTHRVRPYLILNKTRFHIEAFQCSSKSSDCLNNYEEYIIRGSWYNKRKNSFINLSALHNIPFFSIISYYLSLTDFDLGNIEKRLRIRTDNNYSFEVPYSLFIGDVFISEQRLFYVYKTDNTWLYVFEIWKKPLTDSQSYEIIINDKHYHTKFQTSQPFKKEECLKIINIAKKDEIDDIEELRKYILNRDKPPKSSKPALKGPNKKVSAGTLVNYKNNKMVVLYKINGTFYGIDMIMYRINPKVIKLPSLDHLEILRQLSDEEVLNILEFLSEHYVKPYKTINNLYLEYRHKTYE